MKKFLLLLCVTLMLIPNASAHKLINFGIKAGINVSTVSGFKDVINGAKPDFTGGLFFEVRPIKWVGFSIEGLYSGQGFKTDQIQIHDWTASFNASLGYIAVPIMVKIYITEGLSINVGYQPSFLVSTKLDAGKNSQASLDMTPVLNSIPVGVSYGFKWGLLLDFRYNIGLTNVNKKIDFIPTIDPNAQAKSLALKNQVYTLSVGWRF
ncbi:MAG: porin family protein [Mucinivorans sp.]